MKIGILTTVGLTLISNLFSIEVDRTLPDYELVKKDFNNGVLDSSRASQIILKDPRLVPKSRGGYKDDVEADKDGLGILVIGKMQNGRIGGVVPSTDNDTVKDNLNFLIKKYGDRAKTSGVSVVDYVKEKINNGTLSGDEADIIKDKLSRNDIVSVTANYSKSFLSIKKGEVFTLSFVIEGNNNNSPITYNIKNADSFTPIDNGNGNFTLVMPTTPNSYSFNVDIMEEDGTYNYISDTKVISAVSLDDFATVEASGMFLHELAPGGEHQNATLFRFGHLSSYYGVDAQGNIPSAIGLHRQSNGTFNTLDGSVNIYPTALIELNFFGHYSTLWDSMPSNTSFETIRPSISNNRDVIVRSNTISRNGIDILYTYDSRKKLDGRTASVQFTCPEGYLLTSSNHNHGGQYKLAKTCFLDYARNCPSGYNLYKLRGTASHIHIHYCGTGEIDTTYTMEDSKNLVFQRAAVLPFSGTWRSDRPVLK